LINIYDGNVFCEPLYLRGSTSGIISSSEELFKLKSLLITGEAVDSFANNYLDSQLAAIRTFITRQSARLNPTFALGRENRGERGREFFDEKSKSVALPTAEPFFGRKSPAPFEEFRDPNAKFGLKPLGI